jgi:L-glutamine---4-(methylsulfanyl)-2-oxobutanoate aminotransferase
MADTPFPTPLSLAVRTEPFQESVIREMTRLGDETDSVNLSQGLPDMDTPQPVIEAALEAVRSGDNQYTFPFGAPAFREAIARKTEAYNHIQVDPETGVTVTCGVSEALMASVFALTDPGDEVIILEPWYENYFPACLLSGTVPRFVTMHQPGYTFDEKELRYAFNSSTRLIFINSPHNPTGKVLAHSELETIAKLCQEWGVIAVTDEIYEYILYDDRPHVSLGSLPGMEDRTVTTSGLGKTYSLTGWRVGWAVADPALTRRIRKVHDYFTICAPAPFQAAGIAALDLPQSYYVEMRQKYSSQRATLLQALDSAGFAYHQPEGAYYVMARFNDIDWDGSVYRQTGWSNDRLFSEYLAREIGVAVVPGSSFYYSDAQGCDCIRINFARKPHVLEEAARRLLKLNELG